MPICRIPGCDFRGKKDEKIWDSHYQEEHGISINNDCTICGERFIALKMNGSSDIHELELFHEVVCEGCGEENPLEKLLLEEVDLQQ